MADQFSANTDDLYTAGGELSDVSSQVKQVLSSLQATLAGYGQPWGNDSTGSQFANGSDGYLAQMNWVFGAIGSKTDLIDSYSTSITNAAKTFEQQDNS